MNQIPDLSKFLDDDFSALEDYSKQTASKKPEHVKNSGPSLKDTDPELYYHTGVKWHWMYSAKHGNWWLYNAECNEDLENAFLMDCPEVVLLTNGKKFTVDLHRMMQGHRMVQRLSSEDLDILRIRGIAGCYYNPDKLKLIC